MSRIIPLWSNEAPYTAFSPDQAQPTLREFAIPGSRGAVVVCPGGGYAMKAPHEGDPICEMLNEADISAYTLDYRVAPCHPMAPVGDALRAIRVVRSLGYEKVGILGFSAGGHLTCSAATLYTPGDPNSDDPIERLSSRPDAFVPCYPVVSLMAYPHIGSRVNLLGDDDNANERLRMFSCEQNVTRDTPPAFIWHTAPDKSVPVENSLMLAAALSRCEVPYELHIFDEGQHGLGLAPELPKVARWAGLCQKWLLSQGFGK